MQMQSQPGVFAVLLGSGVSTGAGLPTGWQIVKQLVRRAAVARDPENDGPLSDQEVEGWWAQNGSGELGYSAVLEMLAPLSAGRQALLESFFEPDADSETGPLAPSAAHRALARMVASGIVRVILTTNFDRLMEQALAQEGVYPQVISRPEAVAGMKPLAHAPATVIKLHGDYKDLTTLNTPQELEDYPPEWQRLVAQVLDEYGLLIAGWSADWDKALVRSIQSSTSRRYPLYWDSRSSRGATAQELLATRSGITIPSDSADTLFKELEASVAALQRLAEPPITTAIAVSRVKRYLHDPTRRVDLHDLVMSRLEPIRLTLEEQGVGSLRGGAEEYGQRLDAYAQASVPLLNLLITGVRHDDEGRHNGLWADVLNRLLAMRRLPDGTFNRQVWAAQHYPALLAFYAMGAASIVGRNESLFITLGRDVTWKYPFSGGDDEPAALALRSNEVLDSDTVNQLDRWGGKRWQQPSSHLIRADLYDLLDELTPNREATEQLLHDMEYRHAVLLFTLYGERHRLPGEYRGDRNWGDGTLAATGQRFRASAARGGAAWPWWTVIGDDLESTLTDLERLVS